MSNKALNHVIQHSKQSGSALVLMIILADMANNDGECWPGKANLSKLVRVTPRHIVKLIQQCEAAGELRILYRQIGLYNQTNLYRLNLENPSVAQDTSSVAQDTTLVSPRTLGSVAQDTRGSVAQDTTLVSPRTPDPLYIPHLEPKEKEIHPPPSEPIFESPMHRAIWEQKHRSAR